MAILAVFRSLIWLGMTSLPPPSSVTGAKGTGFHAYGISTVAVDGNLEYTLGQELRTKLLSKFGTKMEIGWQHLRTDEISDK